MRCPNPTAILHAETAALPTQRDIAVTVCRPPNALGLWGDLVPADCFVIPIAPLPVEFRRQLQAERPAQSWSRSRGAVSMPGVWRSQ